MKAMNKATSVAGGLLVIFASTVVSQADVMIGDSLSVTFQNVSPARAVSWSFDDGSTTHVGINSAGVFNWSGGLKSFCIQLEENISAGSTTTYDVVDLENLPDQPPMPGPLGESRADVMRDLFARNYDLVMSKTGSDARNYAAAFQIMVWEISHELSADTTDASSVLGGLAVGTGQASFDASSTVIGLANSMLGELGDGGFFGFAGLLGLTNENRQDQLVVVPGAGAFAGLAGVAAIRGRRRRD
jgi:hypothetical protein